MSREKQIEEMAKHCHFYEKGKCLLLEEDAVKCDMNCDMCKFAKTLYNAGYRKSSDVAREIFEEIDKARKKWDTVHNIDHFGYNGSAFGYLEADVDLTIYELKKKYESEKDNGN